MKRGLFKTIQKLTSDHAPELLTGLGIAGMLTTVVVAVKVTPKALTLMEEKKEELGVDQLSVKETVVTTWKCYAPVIATAAVSTACIIGANSVHAKRSAALAAAYTLSDTALRDYKAKVVETFGERKGQAIREEIVKDKVQNDPVENHEIIITAKGDTLCYDTTSGRYFKSSMEYLKRVANDLDRRLRDEMFISVNDFYDEVGLPTLPIMDDLGWDVDKDSIDFKFDSHLATDGTPCLTIDYIYQPRHYPRN